jgi:hypothetical protein
VKYLARAIALASILLGAFLVSRTYLLENQYISTLPRTRDPATGRTVPMILKHDVGVYGTEPDSKALDTARTYVTFGWPFVVLGVLLAAASRERRISVEAAPESESQWSARR